LTHIEYCLLRPSKALQSSVNTLGIIAQNKYSTWLVVTPHLYCDKMGFVVCSSNHNRQISGRSLYHRIWLPRAPLIRKENAEMLQKMQQLLGNGGARHEYRKHAELSEIDPLLLMGFQ
jgi:hypothetical protein